MERVPIAETIEEDKHEDREDSQPEDKPEDEVEHKSDEVDGLDKPEDRLSLNDLPPRPKTPEEHNGRNYENRDFEKMVEIVKQLGKQNEYLKNGLDETRKNSNNVSLKPHHHFSSYPVDFRLRECCIRYLLFDVFEV